MNRNFKNFLMTTIFLAAVFIIPACSFNKDVYKQELFQFDNVFINRSVFEDTNYVYVAGLEEDDNITRINKKTEQVEDLNVSGYNLTVYKDYLYYINKNKNRSLYRINLNKLDEQPELVSEFIDNTYYIADDLIYFFPAYSPVFSMNVNDFSQTTDYFDRPEIYFIAGIDEKYRYIIIKNDIEGNQVYTLARCVHKDTKFENKEYLFDVVHPEWAEYRFNDFLVIKGEFAYYVSEGNLYKCELKADGKSEIIYESSETDRFNMVAVTDDGIYITKYHIEEPPAEIIYDNDYVYRLDFNGKNEISLNHPQLPYFVSNEDGKLKYIQDNKIYPVD